MGNSASRTSAPPAPEPPVQHQQQELPQPPSAYASACPVPPQYRQQSPIYNVYNQRIDNSKPSQNPLAALSGYNLIDPTNNMPLEPNQMPFPGQKKNLSTERIVSNIPKGGTESTWVYPSAQMFFNALKRKGKGDDVTEDDMESVVHAHNTMNEITWNEVQRWERLHANECDCTRLRRFLGRPDDLSPLARLRGTLGGPVPFDRHDWYVDRCGQEVRYVIDFYFNDDKAGTPEAFEITVRPAMDSFESALDRAKMAIYVTFAKYGLPCPITGHPSGSFSQEGEGQQVAEQAEPSS